jgi:ribosomal protein S18 acetylase RimI-like enzyme
VNFDENNDKQSGTVVKMEYMSLIIREVQNNDLNGLLKLYTYLHEKSIPEKTENLLNLWQEILADSTYHIFVGELDGKIVSSCTLVVVKNLTRGASPYAFIENVVTDVRFRERGFASSLLKEAVEIARLSDCYKIMLMTGSKKAETLRFYNKLGFNSDDKTAFICWI